MSKDTPPWCCYIDCDENAEYSICPEEPEGPEDYTHSCAKHIGDMLTDAHAHIVERIKLS